MHTPTPYFVQQYPLGKGSLKNCAISAIDPAIFCLNKTLNVPVKDILVFKDPVEKKTIARSCPATGYCSGVLGI